MSRAMSHYLTCSEDAMCGVVHALLIVIHRNFRWTNETQQWAVVLDLQDEGTEGTARSNVERVSRAPERPVHRS
jgi:hypothetical protein